MLIVDVDVMESSKWIPFEQLEVNSKVTRQRQMNRQQDYGYTMNRGNDFITLPTCEYEYVPWHMHMHLIGGIGYSSTIEGFQFGV